MKPHIVKSGGQWWCGIDSVQVLPRGVEFNACYPHTRSWDGPDKALRKWMRVTYQQATPAWALKLRPKTLLYWGRNASVNASR
jgi:hypothetical protein